MMYLLKEVNLKIEVREKDEKEIFSDWGRADQ